MRHVWRGLFVGVICLALGGRVRAADRPIDFVRDVRPILSDHCFTCHGPDDKARKASLRLDLRDQALKGGKSKTPAIVPGDAAKSELVRRITTADPDDLMPPPDAKKPLSASQIETLKRWVASGAAYGTHWAFTAPMRPPTPALKDSSWPRNDIDRFILARLESQNLRPSPEADRAALLRRLSLDLIGLPPSPKELDAFINDIASDAYEKQVDRLLASPHFGEKWARHWLDVARYADSDGFEKDLPRKQWAWRDWVINAINRDLPYDQFVIEQLAGDLLPNATQDNRIATGFLRNGMVNEEGAIIAEQFRMEGLFDRMDTIGKSVLGLTLQCAQCHTHKYDPITHDEYYRLMAFINNDYEAVTWVYNDQQLQQIKNIRQGIEQLEQKIKSEHPDWPQKLAAWEEAASKEPTAWEHVVPLEQEWVGGLSHPEKLPDNSVLTLGFRPSDGDLYVIAETKQSNITGLRLEALTHGDLAFGGPGRSYKGTFAISEIIVEAQKPDVKDGKWEKLKLASATADFEQPEQLIEEFFRRNAEDKRKIGPAAFLVDGKEDTAWGADRGLGRRHQDSTAVMQFEKPAGYPEGTKFKIGLRYKHSGSDIHGRHNQFLGRFRLSLTTDKDPKVDPLTRAVREILNIPAGQRTSEQQAAVFSQWRATVPDLKPINDQIEALWKQFPDGETVLNLAQRKAEDARQTYVMERGSWQKPAKPVAAGVPGFLQPLPPNAGANRLTLAKWLVDKNSPTTARVAVNRVWQAIFGIGLVETAEDFGVRASTPIHQDLLDCLAIEFMEKNWSQKQLLRTIVTSATYRQQSRITPDLLERDPRNLLLARGPRFRAEAEVIRDVALSAGDILHEKVGGPSFFPPVPESMFALSYLKVDFWQTAAPPERYRRSIYVFRRRSMPDPLLGSFDAPNGDFSCARRPRSNTPLSALASLNEPVMAEAARALAIRTLKEGGKTDPDRAAYAFRVCTSRVPRSAEVEEIIKLLNAQRERIKDGWLSAREIATGDPAKAPEVPPGTNPTDAAAWTIVSRVLLNLDETVTKN
jgi:hypothetical protein